MSGIWPANLRRARLEEAERRRVGVAARVDRELEVVVGIVARPGWARSERAGPCSKPWSTGRMTSLPVPASVPWLSRRARLVSVPGLSDAYQERICFTRSVTAMGRLPWVRFRVGARGRLARVSARPDRKPSPSSRARLWTEHAAGHGDAERAVRRRARRMRRRATASRWTLREPHAAPGHPPAALARRHHARDVHPGGHAAASRPRRARSPRCSTRSASRAKLITSKVRRAGLANVLGYTGRDERAGRAGAEARRGRQRDADRSRSGAAVTARRSRARSSRRSRSSRPTRAPSTSSSSTRSTARRTSTSTSRSARSSASCAGSDHDGTGRAERTSCARAASSLAAGLRDLRLVDDARDHDRAGRRARLHLRPDRGRVLPVAREHPDARARARRYSINEGNSARWTDEVQRWNAWIKEEDKADGRPYGARYVGSLVADAHRTLLKGGIFAYPADKKSAERQAAAPLRGEPVRVHLRGRGRQGDHRAASASSTSSRQQLHQRVPLVLGSPRDVDVFEQFMRGDR